MFYDSYFTGKDTKQRFLTDFRHQADLKVGELYENIKYKKGCSIPPVDIFRMWVGGDKEGLANTIESNTNQKEEGMTCKIPRVRLSGM